MKWQARENPLLQAARQHVAHAEELVRAQQAMVNRASLRGWNIQPLVDSLRVFERSLELMREHVAFLEECFPELKDDGVRARGRSDPPPPGG